MRKLLPLFVGALLAGCGGGGGSPTTPSAPPAAATPAAPTRIVLRDGATGQQVGELPAPSTGSRFSATLAGYLPRVALFRGEDVYLWPQEESYTTSLVYTAADDKTYPMGRWASRAITVGVPDDPRTRAAVAPAVAEAAAVRG